MKADTLHQKSAQVVFAPMPEVPATDRQVQAMDDIGAVAEMQGTTLATWFTSHIGIGNKPIYYMYDPLLRKHVRLTCIQFVTSWSLIFTCYPEHFAGEHDHPSQ